MTMRGNCANERMVFAFSGAAPISGAPIRALAECEPVFDEALRECDAILLEEAGWSLRQALWKLLDGELLTRLPLNFPAVVALQISMFRLLRHHGLDADRVIGMSCGEVSGAFAAGTIGLREALRITVQGGRLMEPQAVGFRMALVWLPAERCIEALAPWKDRISIAALMEPDVTAVSGEHAAIATLLAMLTGQGIRAQGLPFGWGAHTALLRDGQPAFEAALRSLSSQRPRRRIMSTARGQWMDQGFDVGHWWHMFRSPVLFMPAVQRMIDEGVSVFVEVGPASAITHLIPQIGGQVVSFPDALVAAKQSAPRVHLARGSGAP